MIASSAIIATRERTQSKDASIRDRTGSGALGGVLAAEQDEASTPSPRAWSPFPVPVLLEADRDLEASQRLSGDLHSQPSSGTPSERRADDEGTSVSSSASTSSSIGSVSSVSTLASAATSPNNLVRSPRNKSPRGAMTIGLNRSSARANTGLETLELSPVSSNDSVVSSTLRSLILTSDAHRPLSKSMNDLRQVLDPHAVVHAAKQQTRAVTHSHAFESISALQAEDAQPQKRPSLRSLGSQDSAGMAALLHDEIERSQLASNSQGSAPGADWRETLRQQWREDLAVNRRQEAETRKAAKKRLEQLEQRRQYMRGMTAKAETKIREFRERETQFRSQAKEHLDRYGSWHALALRQMYRGSASLQLVHLLLNRLIMERKAALLAARMEEIQKWMAAIRTSPEKVPPTELFDDATTLFSRPEITRVVARIKRITATVQAMQPDLVRLRSASIAEGISRVARAKQLLEATQMVEGLPLYHELHAQRQRAFDAILLDERQKEGKAVARLRKAMVDRAADVTPADVVDFLESFTEQVAKDWELEHALHPRLRLYILRSVFPLIWPECANMVAHDHLSLAADADLAARMSKLRQLSPVQMDLDPLCFAEGDPLSEAVSSLNSLPFDVVPLDLLYTVRRTIQLVLEALKRMQSVGGRKGIAADDILPALIWVVTRSDVAAHHAHVLIMDAFSAQSDKMGEFGYCLTSYQAAVMHLSTRPLV